LGAFIAALRASIVPLGACLVPSIAFSASRACLVPLGACLASSTPLLPLPLASTYCNAPSLILK
jgi:hypothetical protein